MRADRLEELAGDEAVEVGLRRENEEGAEAPGGGIRQPGRGDEAAYRCDGRGELLAKLGVLARRRVTERVADDERVHMTTL